MYIASYNREYKEEYLHLDEVCQVVEHVWFDWCDFIAIQISVK